MDFLTAVKASSIVLTGAFGMLGVVKDFKDKKTNKVTSWGHISLGGIFLCTTLGFIAQVKESSDDATKALSLAQQNNEVLNQIQRGVHRFEDPVVDLHFKVPCDINRYKQFCGEVRRARKVFGPTFPAREWHDWPTERTLEVTIGFSKNFIAGIHVFDPEHPTGDLSLIADTSKNVGLAAVLSLPDFGDTADSVWISFTDHSPTIESNDGEIAGMNDLANATATVSCINYKACVDLELTDFSMHTRTSGEQVRWSSDGIAISAAKKKVLDNGTVWTFPLVWVR